MKSSDDELAVFEIGAPFTKRIPGGLYDKQIMCAEADHSLGPFDDYAAKFFTWGIAADLYVDATGRRAYRISTYDFEKLHLFLLSYFWRCHHAQVAMMKGFRIGNYFAEHIRLKLLD